MIDEAKRETKRIKAQCYYQKNKAKINVKTQKYRKQHWVRYHDHSIKCNKSPYPIDNICPGCGGNNRQLQWHHWYDIDYDDGLWLCAKCHFFLGILLHQMVMKQDELKRSLKTVFKENRETK